MKLIAFFKYLTAGLFSGVFQDMKEIFLVVTKKKTWVFLCFVALIITFFMRELKLMLLAGFLFLFFFITYEWQVFTEQYTHQQREKYGWKKVKERG